MNWTLEEKEKIALQAFMEIKAVIEKWETYAKGLHIDCDWPGHIWIDEEIYFSGKLNGL